MSVVAFNFTKIAGERRQPEQGKLSVNNQTKLLSIKESPLGSQKALLFTFEHVTEYEPKLATITMVGEVLVLSNEAEIKETLELFSKQKPINKVLTEKVFNNILTRVSLQALLMARDLNLPAPFRLPSVSFNEAGPAAPAVEKPADKAKGKKK